MTPPAPDPSTTLVLRRAFAVSRERVFRAWIKPAALERWLRPRDMDMTVSKLEARAGGSFRFDLANGAPIFGTFLRIIPPEKLVFTCSRSGWRPTHRRRADARANEYASSSHQRAICWSACGSGRDRSSPSWTT